LLGLLVLALTLTSCADRDEPGLLEPSFAAGGSKGFPHVTVTTHLPHGSHGPKVGSLAEAVALVRPGGTIVVEDGVWETDGVVIDRPLTMTRKGNDAPRLVNTSPDGPGLVINGVAQGTVELRDLTLENAAGRSAVLVTGTYDRVVIRDSRVAVTYAAAPTEEGRALGVRAEPGTVPDAQLIVEHSTFTGGRFGVLAQGTTAHVRGNHFTGNVVVAVQYTLEARGTIEDNAVDGCGTNACILVWDPAGIEVASNTLRHEVGVARQGIRALTSGGGPYAVAIRDNDLIGIGVQPDDVDPYSGEPFGRLWDASAFSYGILVTGPIAAVIEANRVGGAHIGISGLGAIRANRVWDCGGICIHTYQPLLPTVMEGNVVLGDVGFRRTGTALFARSQTSAAPVTIRNNTVTGNRNAGNPGDPLSYAFKIGIQAMSWNPWDADGAPVETGQSVAVYGNTVTDVGEGLAVYDGGFIVAHDNVLAGMAHGVSAGNPLSVLQATRNDVLDAAVAALGDGAITATCNWWGSVAGPAMAWVPAGVYTPWAVVPIANRPGVECP
jgi:hypothetical protein